MTNNKDNIQDVTTRLADQFLQGNSPKEAIEWGFKAGKETFKEFRYAESEKYFPIYC